MDYVHFNPVKHGYVEKVSDWPYSTFKVCVRRGLYPPTWVGSGTSEIEVGEPRSEPSLTERN